MIYRDSFDVNNAGCKIGSLHPISARVTWYVKGGRFLMLTKIVESSFKAMHVISYDNRDKNFCYDNDELVSYERFAFGVELLLPHGKFCSAKNK